MIPPVSQFQLESTLPLLGYSSRLSRWSEYCQVNLRVKDARRWVSQHLLNSAWGKPWQLGIFLPTVEMNHDEWTSAQALPGKVLTFTWRGPSTVFHLIWLLVTGSLFWHFGFECVTFISFHPLLLNNFNTWFYSFFFLIVRRDTLKEKMYIYNTQST